jgi:hypothetical protein
MPGIGGFCILNAQVGGLWMKPAVLHLKVLSAVEGVRTVATHRQGDRRRPSSHTWICLPQMATTAPAARAINAPHTMSEAYAETGADAR